MMHTHSRGWKVKDGAPMRNSMLEGKSHAMTKADRRSAIAESK